MFRVLGIALMLLTIFTACEKDSINELSDHKSEVTSNDYQELIGELEALSSTYSNSGTTIDFRAPCDPDWKQTALADGAGAAAGALAGPVWAAVTGTLSSWYDTRQQQNNCTCCDCCNGLVISNNDDNPYDYVGHYHNDAMFSISQDSNTLDSILDKSGNWRFDYVEAHLPDTVTVPNINSTEITPEEVDSIANYFNTFTKDSIIVDKVVNDLYSDDVILNSEGEVLDSYWSTLLSLSTVSEIENYSIEAEASVNNDDNISQDSKNMLLQVMAVTRNSAIFSRQ